MTSPNIKDLLTSFSPTSEFYAISSGDGRVKIWDTLRGRLQMEFVNLSTDNAGGGIMESKHENGHLSLDYTCMQWARLGKKNKRKPGHLLLVLGTGGGDVLALDVSAGQLKWKVSDCHTGGVTAISLSEHFTYVYTAGVDGLVCRINSKTGDLLQNFRASTKAISSLTVSPDGNMFVTASAQLKVFSSNNKKIQKFSGHPVGVRCVTFSEDGKFILSSGVGERFIAFWKMDRSVNHVYSACCVLSMEHPAVSLSCKGSESTDSKGSGIYVLAISEIGLCYFWHGKSIEEMRNSKPTKISVSVMHATLKNKGSMPKIYSGKIQSIGNQASGVVLVACCSIVKPSFERLTVQYGIDVNISSSQESAFLPAIQFDGCNKDQASQARVTVLDRANAEDATIPLPIMIHDHQDKKKRKHSESHITADLDHQLTDVVKESNQTQIVRKVHEIFEEQYVGISLEDKLKSAGILAREDLISSENCVQVLSTANFDATIFKNASLLVGTNAPTKKKRETLLSMFHGDAFKLFAGLVIMWKTRSVSEEKVVPWICHILTHHNYSIMSQKASKQILEGLHKMTRFKCLAVGSLLRLSGSLQLITAQIDKVGDDDKDTDIVVPSEPLNESDNDEDIDEVLYGEEEVSESSGDDG